MYIYCLLWKISKIENNIQNEMIIIHITLNTTSSCFLNNTNGRIPTINENTSNTK